MDTRMFIPAARLAEAEQIARAVTEAVVRLLPGALGHEDSARDDSFSEGESKACNDDRSEMKRSTVTGESSVSSPNSSDSGAEVLSRLCLCPAIGEDASADVPPFSPIPQQNGGLIMSKMVPS